MSSGNCFVQRFAGPAPRGEGHRMPSCLQVEIMYANLMLPLYSRTGQGRRAARPVLTTGGPARAEILTAAAARALQNGRRLALALGHAL